MAKKAVKKKSPVKEAQKKFSKKPEKKKFVQEDCHGALFKNEDKEKSSQPDYKGSYTDANGEKHWVSAWVNESQAGKKYISFVTQAAEEVEDEESEDEESEDELPFS